MISIILKKPHYFAVNVVAFTLIMVGTLNAADDVPDLNHKVRVRNFSSDVRHDRIKANSRNPNKEHLDDLLEADKMPVFIDVLIKFVPVPLPHNGITATYKYSTTTWPSVPLYPANEFQFVSALQLVYGGIMKIRKGENEREDTLIRGKTIVGFEMNVQDNHPIHTYEFDYQKTSIQYQVQERRDVVPIWPVGGFYRPGCDLDDVQQMLCALFEEDQKTFVRKTLLSEWIDQGYYPPLAAEADNRITVFQTNRKKPYLSFVEDIRKGVATLEFIDLTSHNRAACFTYKSINLVSHGKDRAFLSFIRS